MSLNEVSAEKLAELFHHYHQALAPDFGCTGEEKGESWQQVSQPEKSRMVAAVRLTLLELDARQTRDEKSRYFARAGEAEWGC